MPGKKEKKKKKPVWLLLLLLIPLFYYSCNGEKEEGPEDPPNIYQSEMVAPQNGGTVKVGQPLPVTVRYKDGGKTMEEITIWINNKKVYSSDEKKTEHTYLYPADSVAIGAYSVRAESKMSNGSIEPLDVNVYVVSDIVPRESGYKVVAGYPHDAKAFTQGLFIDKGLMYEGTGQYGSSELRLVDHRQNKILKSVPLGGQYFGEGIALAGDKIYQLTYREGKGFVYDKNTFSLLKEFSYPTEGWGLTFDGTHLVMSDGTSTLYFYDPQEFKLVRKVQVADDTRLIPMLNELEYINGEIWANVWMKDEILVIDPATGKVKERINMSGLLPMSQRAPGTDVLNGIAYDAATGKIYVTGKNWPALYEIQKVEKSS